jgi:RHH-type transcriptional regulator, rel operon repressor / antitoxin RelB
MISLRLPSELEEKLDEISSIENKTKTDIVKESLHLYMQSRQSEVSPYNLAQKYFGHSVPDSADSSVNHSEIIRNKIRKKHND